MYGPDAPDTFWLTFTNISLGLVTLLCVLVVAGGVARELLHRRGRRVLAREDDHAFATPGLGVTMADGGERLDERKPADRKAR
ncbi:MAG TPA: hypothetical protein VLF95_09640 [Vicinamibacteria bacterium]|nr:hypothetical protein [Vicinamibacteria bacterium]